MDSILEETKQANSNELRRRLGVQEKEIRRLLETIDRLNLENTQLLSDCQGIARVRRENEALRAQMKNFRACYRDQFCALKRAMEEMKRSMKDEEQEKEEEERRTSKKKSGDSAALSPRNRHLALEKSLLMMSSAQLDFPFALSIVDMT